MKFIKFAAFVFVAVGLMLLSLGFGALQTASRIRSDCYKQLHRDYTECVNTSIELELNRLFGN